MNNTDGTSKKKLAVIVLCITLATLTASGLFGSVWWMVANAKDLQLGGLVGDLLAGRDNGLQLFPDNSESEQELPTEPPADTVKPRFFVNAKALQSDLSMGTLMQDGAYLSLVVDRTWKDYFSSLLPVGSSYSNVKYLVIAYRTSAANARGEFWLAARQETSGSSDFQSVNIPYQNDGKWHTAVIDITGLFPDNPHHYLSHLSLTPLRNPQSGQSIDIAYVAGFSSLEDAEKYIDQYQPPASTAAADSCINVAWAEASKSTEAD